MGQSINNNFSEAQILTFQKRCLAHISFSYPQAFIDDTTPPTGFAQLLRYPQMLNYLCSPVEGAKFENPLSEFDIRRYVRNSATVPILENIDLQNIWSDCFDLPITDFPCFFQAAPHPELAFDFSSGGNLNVAVLTAGGVAPGLNAVIAQVVRRLETYATSAAGKYPKPTKLNIMGYFGGFRGLAHEDPVFLRTEPGIENQKFHGHTAYDDSKLVRFTGDWSTKGGSLLVAGRGEKKEEKKELDLIISNLEHTDILICIGGNGTMRAAHQIGLMIKERNLPTKICAVPKTIDNDILWAEASFGLSTAVDQAVSALEVMHTEAASTRRVAVVQLMGRDSGFIAANASLASGVVDLCLIPEVHRKIDLKDIIQHMEARISNRKPRYGIIAVAEGCGTQKSDSTVWKGVKPGRDIAANISKSIKKEYMDSVAQNCGYILRSAAPNATDRILCHRLANLVIDNVLAGFSDFCVIPRGNRDSLVPLSVLSDGIGGIGGPKKINPQGKFWSAVSSRNRQGEFDSRCIK